MIRPIPLVLFLFLLSFQLACTGNTTDVVGVCRHVVDGDSLYIKGEPTQIRLWGVDAPERDEVGYREATQSLKQMALGQTLRCKRMDVDKYDRIVARCFIENKAGGIEINRQQIAVPEVKEYCRFSENFYGQCKGRR
jgi:endonuclease YncB( thermonuclease family)